MPAPDAQLLFSLDVPLEARVEHPALGADQARAAMKAGGHLENAQTGDQVILVGKISNGPDDARGGGLGVRFDAELDLPFPPVAILGREFRARLFVVFLHETERAARSVLCAARSVIE